MYQSGPQTWPRTCTHMSKMNRSLNFAFLGAILALLFPFLSFSQNPTEEGSGKLFRQLSNSGDEDTVILEYNYDRPTKGVSRDSRKRHEVELSKVPSGGPAVPTFASELSTSVMNEELKRKIDDEYMSSLRSYMYFHGYSSTSLDVRSRVMFNIKPEEELKVRREMAVSVRNYMFSRGIPKFLSSREQTKGMGEKYEKAVNSTHLSFNLSKPSKEKDAAPPWVLKTGVDPFRMEGYARVTNQVWSFEGKQNMRHMHQVEFLVLRSLRKRSFGSRYNLDSRDLTPFYSYSFTRNLNGSLGITFPLKADQVMVQTVTRVSMSYAF